MLDALAPVVVDRICLFLNDIRDASSLQKACRRLRWAGLGPECKWHWQLNTKQSLALCISPLRDRILGPGTAVRTLDACFANVTGSLSPNNVHTLLVTSVPSGFKFDKIHALYLVEPGKTWVWHHKIDGCVNSRNVICEL